MKTFKTAFILVFALTMHLSPTVAQTVVTIPVFPNDNDSCTVIYDAAQGNAELKNVPPPIYAHTGVITNLSTSGTDWKYVIAGWSENTPKATMTPLGGNLYEIKMKPNIRAFYGVPEGESILKLAFVFRTADGSKVGREANGSDIYADVYSNNFSINIIEPSTSALYLKLNDPINVDAVSPLADSMEIYLNGNLEKKVAGTSIQHNLIANNFGQNWAQQWVKIVALNTTGSVADSFFYSVIPEPTVANLPENVIPGINYIDSTSAILCLYAPYKNNVFIVGDFNDWEVDSAFYMFKTPDGSQYWKQLNNLEPRKEYIFQYLVDGTLKIADPYADKISDPDDKYISPATYPGLKPFPTGKTTGIASYLQTAQVPFAWETENFSPPKTTDLVIYEMLLRDFLADHSYTSLIDTLDYFQRLGINAIELMPVMEFEGNISWGYNPDFMFAPDKYYGPKDQLKLFIDAAHKKGIAVILDIVLNHQFGKSPLVQLYWDQSNNRPASNSPWFNPIPKHPYNVGYDFNHSSQQTIAFSKRVMEYWLTEYNVDGFRFDLSKGFTQKNSYPSNVDLWGQYDVDRINTWKNYYTFMHSVKPGAFVILEHFADNQEEKELASAGMLLWGNLNYNYNEATMGWYANSNFEWISYKTRGWTQPQVVGYMESHDEERIAFKNISYGNTANPDYNTKDTVVSMDRIQMAAAFFFTIPGPKMIWQFGELGYAYSKFYPSGTESTKMNEKPIRWDYYNQWQRKYLYDVFASLIDLKKNNDIFESTDFTVNVGGAMKRININSPSMDMAVVGNFDVYENSIVPSFSKTGTWYDYFSGDSIQVTDLLASITLQPGEYHIYSTRKLQKPTFTGLDDSPQIAQIAQIGWIYPNPANQLVNIELTLKKQMSVTISFFDLTGRCIQQFDPINLGIGTHLRNWNLNNFSGFRVPSGIYFCRIEYDNKSEMHKMIVD